MTAAGERAAPRVALVAGAVGRFGEALLNRVLGSGDYRMVVALAQAPMALGVRGLALAALHELPPLDDVFVALSAHHEGEGRSFHGRDAPFVQVGAGQLLAVARAACDAGASRLVLIAPTSVWQQMGGMHAGLSGETELALAGLPLASLTVMPATSKASRAVRTSSILNGLMMAVTSFTG